MLVRNIKKHHHYVSIPLMVAMMAFASAYTYLQTFVVSQQVAASFGDCLALPGAVSVTPYGGDQTDSVALQAHYDTFFSGSSADDIFCFAAGTYYEFSIVPEDGQQFIGEYGAVLSGARLLNPADATQDIGNNRWSWAGQTQQGMAHGSTRSCFDFDGPAGRDCNENASLTACDVRSTADHYWYDGTPSDLSPEQLIVNNTTVLCHEESLAELNADGEWYFDYAANTIYMYDSTPADLNEFSVIETSVQEYAIAQEWWRYATPAEFPDDIIIDNLVIEKYANPAQFGAIGAQSYLPNGNGSDSWQIRNVESRYNHGCGIRISNGGTLENSVVRHNGQIGVCGSGESAEGSMPMTMRNTNIHNNLTLDFSWGWEGGAMKFSYTDGLTVENNWVHDNAGPGVWYDINNYNATIRSNLVENNHQQAIFYEISYGPAAITCNQISNNGWHETTEYTNNGAGVYISSSDGDSGEIVIADNVLDGNRLGIYLHSEIESNGRYDDQNGNSIKDPGEPYYEVDKVNIQRNEISTNSNDSWVMHLVANQDSIATGLPTTYTIDNNVYYTPDGGAGAGSTDNDWLFRYNTGVQNPLDIYNFSQWQSNTEEFAGFDTNSTNLDKDLASPSLPGSCATPFVASTYGPVDNIVPIITLDSPADGATLAGNVALNATASDNETSIDRVVFSVDGTPVNSDSSAPYSYSLDTTTLSNAAHTISVTAYDEYDNYATAAISVSVINIAKTGDINDDGNVDIFDLSILLSNYEANYPAADLNSDGIVDIFDLSILLSNYES